MIFNASSQTRNGPAAGGRRRAVAEGHGTSVRSGTRTAELPPACPDGVSAAAPGAACTADLAAGAAQRGKRLRPIAALDLAAFERPAIPFNRSLAWRAAWLLTSALAFQPPLALLPSRVKAAILRAFGARVGRGVVVKPRVTIKSPWFLTLGDHVWLGEAVWIDNHTSVTVGSNVCISQGAVLFTGNHDWSDPKFAFFSRPVTVGDGAWVTAFQRLGPGAIVPPGVAVTDAP